MLIVRSQNFPKINVDSILSFNIIDIVLLFTHHEKLRVRGDKRAGLGVSPSNLKDYNHENHLKYYQSEI